MDETSYSHSWLRREEAISPASAETWLCTDQMIRALLAAKDFKAPTEAGDAPTLQVPT
jgi:hypothetical protein